ncbi:MAG: elongation factor Ts [Bacteroidales bacterium]|nr:elongation factor Ts [Candidatus Liminaster caballi]
MAVSIADIKKLRELTQAGMGDCKKALEESNGDFDAAVKWIREKFTKIAAKREAREASEGLVIARTEGNFAAIVAMKCETESVANNDRFAELANTIADLVMANKPADQAALLALPLEGSTVADVITERSGACGEKMEVAYEHLEGEGVVAYNHFNKKLSAIVAFNQAAPAEALKEVACQVAAMNPLAVNADEIPQAKKDEELELAVKKTKEEQVEKAVAAALKKAGLNPNHFDSEDHIESNMSKGWITAEEAAKGREIMTTVAAEKAANLPEQMVQNIAKGRMAKFFKENCLVEQEFISDAKINVQQYLEKVQKGLTATGFKRVNLNQD